MVFHIARSLGCHFRDMWENEKKGKSVDNSSPTMAWCKPMEKYNIIVTNLEHDTNVSPFVRMAEDLRVSISTPLDNILDE